MHRVYDFLALALENAESGCAGETATRMEIETWRTPLAARKRWALLADVAVVLAWPLGMGMTHKLAYVSAPSSSWEFPEKKCGKNA
jgi:hypothetical protein